MIVYEALKDIYGDSIIFSFRSAEELIPSMFRFLVLLSYERHHSKSIIGVPKIMQLCDGLMASGQPPLSHCKLMF